MCGLLRFFPGILRFMTQTFDILTFGSVTLDIIIRVPESAESQPNPQANTWTLPLGDKVQIDTSVATIGGGAVNSSTGFQRLGLDAACFGVIGDQSHRKFILDELKAIGVCTDYLTKAVGTASSFSVILNSHIGERTVFHHRASCETFDADHLGTLPQTRAVYTGHLYPKAESILEALAEEKKKQNFFWGWNPGKTQFRQGLERYDFLRDQVDVLILNREEAERFTGLQSQMYDLDQNLSMNFLNNNFDQKRFGIPLIMDSVSPINQLADVRNLGQALVTAGFKTVAITDGGHGAQIFTADQHFFSPSQDTTIIDTLGAGDAFSVGLLTGLIRGDDLKKSIKLANKSSNSVIQHYGAQAGQLCI